MKNLKLFLFATLAMFVAITGVNAVSTLPEKPSAKLSELEENQRTITNDGSKSVYNLIGTFDNLEVDVDNVIINFDNANVTKLIVSAEDITFANGGDLARVTTIEIAPEGSAVLDGKYASLGNTDVVNKGTLEITGGSYKSIKNEAGTLSIASRQSNLTVNGGTVTVTASGALTGTNVVNDGSLIIEDGLEMMEDYVTVNGGHAISYRYGFGGGLKTAFGNSTMVALLAEDEEGKEIDLVVPVKEVLFDVKVVDKDGNEVSGEVKNGERYIVTPVKYWNGIEVTSKGAGLYAKPGYGLSIADTMPITSVKTADETILVPYTGADKQDNEFIAVANGVATFNITASYKYIGEDYLTKSVTIKGTADSAHSTIAVEPTEPEKDPEAGEPSENPTDNTTVDNTTTNETETPNTVDSIPTYLAAGAVSIIGIALLGFSIKKRMED